MKSYIIFILTVSFLIGLLFGFIVGSIFVLNQVSDTIVDSIEVLHIENFEVGINETYIMDRANESIQEYYCFLAYNENISKMNYSELQRKCTR